MHRGVDGNPPLAVPDRVAGHERCGAGTPQFNATASAEASNVASLDAARGAAGIEDSVYSDSEAWTPALECTSQRFGEAVAAFNGEHQVAAISKHVAALQPEAAAFHRKSRDAKA